MRPKTSSAQQQILTALLDSHERSVSYRRPAPWPRDVILRLDRKAFPDAFAPDGRERRTALFMAASELAREGCIRLVADTRGPHEGTPKEIRLGPLEVDRAFEVAISGGYEPLSHGLACIARHAESLLELSHISWFADWLRALIRTLESADPSLLGMTRERFKKEWRFLPDALAASAALAAGTVSGWERFASERLFGDSKRLSRIRAWIVRVLVAADPRWEGVPPEEAFDLLEAYGLRRKPGLLRCAGVGRLQVRGREIALEHFVPVAHLPDAWAEEWVASVLASGVETITTIENEYPFLTYVEESGGPEALGARRELAIYTAGFPTPALVDALAKVAQRARAIRFRHWGDADLGGVRIWLMLRDRIGSELEPFRTTADWVRKEAEHASRRLSPIEMKALRKTRAQLERMAGGDVEAMTHVVDALLDTGVKLEQESF